MNITHQQVKLVQIQNGRLLTALHVIKSHFFIGVCENCSVMPNPDDCVCCKEVDAVLSKMLDNPETPCITDHPGF